MSENGKHAMTIFERNRFSRKVRANNIRPALDQLNEVEHVVPVASGSALAGASGASMALEKVSEFFSHRQSLACFARNRHER